MSLAGRPGSSDGNADLSSIRRMGCPPGARSDRLRSWGKNSSSSPRPPSDPASDSVSPSRSSDVASMIVEMDSSTGSVEVGEVGSVVSSRSALTKAPESLSSVVGGSAISSCSASDPTPIAASSVAVGSSRGIPQGSASLKLLSDTTYPFFGVSATIQEGFRKTYYRRIRMKITIITLFPEFFDGVLGVSMVGRAIASERLEIEIVPLREFGAGVHRQVDDAPFGGGAGMVLMLGPLVLAVEGREDSHRVLLTPGGRPLEQTTLDRWAELDVLTLVCGRYEGVDERFAENFIDEETSLGDYVLAGGEVAAAAVIEGVARLIPDVLGNPKSLETESFRSGLLEEPQYTRPAMYEGWEVPEVLRSGDHRRIAEWRAEQRRIRTERRRPDLLRGC